MPVYERLSMVVSLILIGLALYFVVNLPTRIIETTILGIPVVFSASSRLLMALLLGGLALTGAGTVVRSHPNERVSFLRPYWVNPTLIVILATLSLAQAESALAWAGGLALTGFFLWMSMLAEYYAIQISGPDLNFYRLWSHGTSYALLLLYAIFIIQLEGWALLKAGGVFVVAWMLGASILKLYTEAGQRVGLWSFVIALALAQLTWVFIYWPASLISVGLLALLTFHILCGLAIAQQQNTLSKRVLAEYAVVAGIGLLLIINI